MSLEGPATAANIIGSRQADQQKGLTADQPLCLNTAERVCVHMYVCEVMRHKDEMTACPCGGEADDHWRKTDLTTGEFTAD